MIPGAFNQANRPNSLLVDNTTIKIKSDKTSTINWTIGRRSGGNTGKMLKNHPFLVCYQTYRSTSRTSKRRTALTRFWPVAASTLLWVQQFQLPNPLVSSLGWLLHPFGKWTMSILLQLFVLSREILVQVVFPLDNHVSCEVDNFFGARGLMSKVNPIRERDSLEYQMCDTGAFSTRCDPYVHGEP